jgi:hypothetical protein
MPTLVNLLKGSSGHNCGSVQKGETTNASEFVWMTNEFGGNSGDISMNDSTLSSQNLEGVLKEIEQRRKAMGGETLIDLTIQYVSFDHTANYQFQFPLTDGQNSNTKSAQTYQNKGVIPDTD